jgi:hypothetical protein
VIMMVDQSGLKWGCARATGIPGHSWAGSKFNVGVLLQRLFYELLDPVLLQVIEVLPSTHYEDR